MGHFMVNFEKFHLAIFEVRWPWKNAFGHFVKFGHFLAIFSVCHCTTKFLFVFFYFFLDGHQIMSLYCYSNTDHDCTTVLAY